MAEPRQQFYQSQRLRLSYWAWGADDAPPLILMHGGRDHARNWDRIAEAFRDDYHVVACDLRGHGDSEWAKGSMASPSTCSTSPRSSTSWGARRASSPTPSAARSRC